MHTFVRQLGDRTEVWRIGLSKHPHPHIVMEEEQSGRLRRLTQPGVPYGEVSAETATIQLAKTIIRRKEAQGFRRLDRAEETKLLLFEGLPPSFRRRRGIPLPGMPDDEEVVSIDRGPAWAEAYLITNSRRQAFLYAAGLEGHTANKTESLPLVVANLAALSFLGRSSLLLVDLAFERQGGETDWDRMRSIIQTAPDLARKQQHPGVGRVIATPVIPVYLEGDFIAGAECWRWAASLMRAMRKEGHKSGIRRPRISTCLGVEVKKKVGRVMAFPRDAMLPEICSLDGKEDTVPDFWER